MQWSHYMTLCCHSCFPLLGYGCYAHVFNQYCIGVAFDLQYIRKQWSIFCLLHMFTTDAGIVYIRDVIGATKSTLSAFLMVIFIFLKNHYKSYGIWFALNAMQCNKNVIQCPEWSLSALLMFFRLFQSSSTLFLTGSTRFFSRPSITPLFIHVFIYYCVGEEEENENKNKKNKNKKNKNKGGNKDNKKNNKNGKSVFIHAVYFIVLLNPIPSLKLMLCLVSYWL